MTRYDDVELPDGSRHPLAGVPEDVLQAAREALRSAVIYPAKSPPRRHATERDLTADPALDGDLESIADGIVAAIRATGWTARSSGLADLGLVNNLVLARRALERLADETPMDAHSTWSGPEDVLDAELEARREYARRAWLGDRVDLKIETNPATTGE